MKIIYRIGLIFIFLFCFSKTEAQVLAPDFSATDVNNQTYNLYNELSQGKTVVLDFFAYY
ncbi:MAG: hypothetical protein JXR58_04350 [Bacteroidales bacterium]|nr:hypothetical protein [Bacteroidales bacterium]